MKFTNTLVWNSVFQICPHFKVMRDNAITVNLPSALKDCAMAGFMRQHNKTIASYDLLCAEYVVGEALEELIEKGYIEFGLTDKIG